MYRFPNARLSESERARCHWTHDRRGAEEADGRLQCGPSCHGSLWTFALSRMGPWGRDARHSITATAPRSVFALMVRDVAPAGSTSDIRRGADGVATAAPNAISVSCANPENSDPSPLRPLAAIAFRSDQGEAAIVYASDHVGSGVRVALQPGRRPLTHARIWVVGFLTAWHERPYRQQGKI